MGRNKALSKKDKAFLLVTIYPEGEKATSITLTTDISGGNLEKRSYFQLSLTEIETLILF